ncbi:MAG: Stk1 family PASTA domain-containing Ser/Thr kinase [Ruminococcus sp.]|nr:Stk1 family PASTA domain-containing Ser/Thr kinase [Ruminococcus sp.]MDE6848562.1 Stk1 family PASTA domain-containing Ser/Thr kinase [Ruminococcus sp.]MDE7136954.1 Stk1 family PASTA domain-containing Ser/Thr kinase [Ruminococcus sp.]
MDKYIGKKLDGRYEITELIGVGGMAEVYKGVDVMDHKDVAIKILKKEYAENEEFLRRFRNESKAIAVLSHPNIVKIYDVGFSEKIQYIVMEYIDGITLKEYIEEEKVLTWKDTVHFVIQILRALQHAHDKGIVHRDIKPQNIMMFTDGTIKVMDFGIAKFAREEGKTATDQAIGSVHYISPEQASGDVTDAKSDIYSVGAMMYEMLTGSKPFDSDNPVAIAVMHMQDIPERPRALNPDIPDGLEEIVLRAMEKAPEDRYQSTAEMISDIDAFKVNPNMTFGYYQEEDIDEDEGTRYYDGSQEDMMMEEGDDYSSQGGRRTVVAEPPVKRGKRQPVYDGYDDDDEEDEPERSSLVVPVLTAIVVVVIIVAVIFVATLLSGLIKGDGQTNDFRMPDFYGMDYNAAVSQYGNNIQFQEDGSEYNELDAGLIIEQDIEPGSEFKKGDVLKVKISKGMETVEVPNVANMNAELARDQLKQRGLECEIKNSSSTEIQKGYVINTEPEVGTEVHKGSTIVLYVSMGVDAGQVSVDDYVGKVADDACTLAEYAGLKPRTELKASYEEEGKVIEQSIAKGEKVEEGTEIIFYVSNGQAPDGEIPFTIPFPTNANGRFVIDFVITNEDGSTTTDSTSVLLVPEMPQVSQNVKGSGENVSVVVVLTNMNTGVRAQIGSYYFNFATGAVNVQTEDIAAAFDAVGGFDNSQANPEPTEPVTDAPVVTNPPVTDPPQPVVTDPPQPTTIDPSLPADFDRWADDYGYYDAEGNYHPYIRYQ